MGSDVIARKLGSLMDLTTADVCALRSVSVERFQVRKRRDLIGRSVEPSHVYVLLSGWAAQYAVRANGTRRITAFMLKGDFCSAQALAGAAMDCSVFALDDCEFGAVAVGEWTNLLASYPNVARAFSRLQLVEAATLRQWLLATNDSVQMVARMLVELYVRAERAELAANGLCELPITQEQVSDALSVTPVHMNRVLRSLRSSGFAQFQHGRIAIHDFEGLKKVAQWDDFHLTPWVRPADRKG